MVSGNLGLSIEEWFYIFTPILIFILHKFLTNKSPFLVSILIMVSLPLMYRFRITLKKLMTFGGM